MSRWSRANEKSPLLHNSNLFTGQRIKTTFFIFFSLLNLNVLIYCALNISWFFWGFSCVFSVQHFLIPNFWGQMLITRMDSFQSLASTIKFHFLLSEKLIALPLNLKFVSLITPSVNHNQAFFIAITDHRTAHKLWQLYCGADRAPCDSKSIFKN